MNDLLAEKSILVTGMLTPSSIAFHVARTAQEQGADVIATGAQRLSLVRRVARQLPRPVPVIELDVRETGQLESLASAVGDYTDTLDGVVHSIAYAPANTAGEQFGGASWDSVSETLHVSAFSMASLTRACLPLLTNCSSVVGIDFDGSRAWPYYDWMGVAKSALESINRYLARDLGERGIRVNLVAAGPISSQASRAFPGFEELVDTWKRTAPLPWDSSDATPVAKAVVAMLSDWFPMTSGEIVHVDGGYHAMGAPLREQAEDASRVEGK